MSLLNVFYQVVTPILLIAGVGYWFGKSTDMDMRALSRAAVYLFIPCLVIESFASLDMAGDQFGRLILLIVLLQITTMIIGWLLARSQHRLERCTQSAIMLSVVLTNSGNYGVPLIEFAFGKAGSPFAIVVMVMMSIMTNTVGVFLASRGTASIRQSLTNVFKVPLPYAILLGVILKAGHIALPVPVDRAISLLGQAGIPVMLLLLGVQLSKISLRTETLPRLRAVTLVSVIRLAVVPIIVVLLAELLGVTGMMRSVAIVQLSMPTAVNAAVLATEFHSDAPFATASILVSTLASMISLSVLLVLTSGSAL